MARIRTVKPDYFRHELLQDLEAENPGLHPMLVYAGLWGQCDKNGVFEYKPRLLKLDILPFLDYDIVASLTLLREAKLITLMIHGAKIYGYVPSFKEHQRITGKEAQEPSKFPQPSEMAEYCEQGNNRETTGKQQGLQEGKGREGEREEESILSSSGDEAQTGGEPFLLTKKGRKLKGKRLDTFNMFWECFDHKKGKAEAADAWHDIPNLTDSLVACIVQGAKREAQTRQSLIDSGRTPKMAQGWLTGRRWEDESGRASYQRSPSPSGAPTAATRSLNAGCSAVPAGTFAGDFPDRSDEW